MNASRTTGFPPAGFRYTGPSRFEDLAAQRQDAVEAIERTQQRFFELRELSAQARRRRAQLQADRERVRAQLALRRSLLNTPDRRAAAAILDAALNVSGMGLHELWLEYFALGGNATVSRLGEMLAGQVPLCRADHDRMAVVLNERLDQAGWGRLLAYWDGSR